MYKGQFQFVGLQGTEEDLHISNVFAMFRGNSALIVLVWSFSCFYVYNRLVLIDNYSYKAQKRVIFYWNGVSARTIVNGIFLFFPLLGMLTDVYWGRYTVIKCSLRVIWFVAVLYCLACTVLKLLTASGVVSVPANVSTVIDIAQYVGLALGFGVFQSNVVQFTFDQLQDVPSGQITSFFRWYAWVWFLSRSTVALTQNCLCEDYEVISTLVIPILLSVSLGLDFFCASWLRKEPISMNPLGTVFRVLKYAVNNKYPRLRSTHSYWDSKLFSRVDLAKIEFGGPFTYEEIENVKTFFRILLLLCFGGLFVGIVLHIDSFITSLQYHFKDSFYDGSHVCTNKKDCYWIVILRDSGCVFMSLFLPLFEFTLHPFLKRMDIPILSKLALGMFLKLLSLCGFAVLEVIGHTSTNSDTNNITCIFYLDSYNPDNVLPLNYIWIVFPNITYEIGNFWIIIAATEFLCAQSPHSMKGLLFGTMYALFGIFYIVNLAWLLPIQYGAKKVSYSSIPLGCGFFFFASVFVVVLLISLFTLCIIRSYKMRNRGYTQTSKEILSVN